MIGLSERDTESGIHVWRIHYTADPLKRDQDWIDGAAEGMLGGVEGRAWKREMEINWSIASGLAVYADVFDREYHVAKQPFEGVYEKLPVYRGWDFGLNPACVWLQIDPQNRINVLDYEVTWDGRGPQNQMGIERFAPIVLVRSSQSFDPDIQFVDYCDPAGWQKAQTDEKSCVDIMRSMGIHPKPGPVTWTARKAAMVRVMETVLGGRAQVQFDPRCTMLIEAMEGAYRFEEIGETGRYKEQVEKNAWSHPMNALEYPIAAVFGRVSRDRRPDPDDRPAPRTKPNPITGY